MSYQRSRVRSGEAIYIPGGLKVGAQIILRGKVPYGSDGFAINFQCAEQDCNIAFHFNPRTGEGETVRNHFEGDWGGEERGQPIFPFNEGSKFHLRIYVTEEEYKVTVNGQDFIDFRHRIPLEEVRYLLLGDGAEYYDISIQNSVVSPYIGEFPYGMKVGQALRLRGTVNRDGTGFAVNLQCDCDGDNIGFHFNPRPQEGCVVRNSKVGDWGGEERDADYFPFNHGDYFDAFFIATESSFNVYVNEKLFTTYDHRCSVDDIKYVTINGDLTVTSVEFYDPLPGDVVKEIPSGLDKSDMIVVKGFFFPEGNSFALNLLYGHDLDDDIALHFNPRRNEGEVVMNCRDGGSWGDEERESIPSAFHELVPFELKIVAKSKKFKIYVNQKKFTEFKARGNVENIKAINVSGDAYFYEAKILRRPDNPQVERIPGNLKPGSWVVVNGTAKKDAQGFAINLQCGESTSYENDVALHFNPRLSEEDSVRNHLQDGNWGDEERDQPNFPFRPKDPFEIAINAQPDEFRIYVNGHHYTDFNHRLDLHSVCHIMLTGDANFFEPEFY